ncbi:MAG: prepilin peptidase [Desulfobulbus sp.]|jgi:leader peptidase (prepilin peptidase)/N-methyltransferase
MNSLILFGSGSTAGLALSAAFGLALGSFLNVVIARLPHGRQEFFKSLFSQCPQCGHRIRFSDNIPVLSYLLLRGRCRDCGQPISIQYPLVELAMAGITTWLFSLYGPTPYFYLYTIFFALLLAVSVIDLRLRQIPDSLVITGCLAGIIGSLFTPLPGWTHAMAGMVFGTMVPLMVVSTYEWLRNTTLIGGGDIKLLGMIGAFLGWQPLGSILFYSAISGVVVAVAVKLAGKPARLPFAPFLTLGTLAALFGPDLSSMFKVLP